MKKQLLLLALPVAVSLAACQSNPSNQPAHIAQVNSPAPNTLSEAEKEEGWKLLFDGKSIDQWRSYGQQSLPAQGWVVKDGALVIEKTPTQKPEGFWGDIITKEQFGNFELSLEFMTTDTANSGIFYLVVEQPGVPIWQNAPEFQILDNPTYEKMEGAAKMNTHRTGDNYDLQAAPADYSKPNGEWNTARILLKDGHVEHWLNGNKTCEYQIASPEWEALIKKSKFKDYPGYGRSKTGHLGLQDHQHEVRFRNIKIRNL
jgi:hypothetical protein